MVGDALGVEQGAEGEAEQYLGEELRGVEDGLEWGCGGGHGLYCSFFKRDYCKRV